MNVFLLWHTLNENEKLIGVYSSYDGAQAALDRAKRLSGFCDAPDGFEVVAYTIDGDNWTEGYVTVYE